MGWLPGAIGRGLASAPRSSSWATGDLRACEVEMSREGISLIVIQRELGHADLAITSRYLRGIDNTEIIQAVYQRPEPMIPAGRQLLPRR
jgi:hypothetical protein